MKIYEFYSSNWNLRALTRDAKGSLLPEAYAPWTVQNSGIAIVEWDSENMLYGTLERRGFFLTSIGMRASSPPGPRTSKEKV